MADTTTTNLGLTKPEIGASADTWGNKLNADLDLVDALFAANGTGTSVGLNVGAGKVAAVAGTLNVTGTVSGGVVAPLASPTFTGTVVLPSTTSIGGVSATELVYLDGVTSNVQTQLDAKLAITAAASTYAPLDGPTFTGTVTLPSTTSIGGVSAAEIVYLDGVTSNVQTQLDGKAGLASPAFTGTPTAPTAASGTNTTQVATTAFVQQTAFNNSLPFQGGNAGKYVTTDGTNASWASVPDEIPAQTGQSGKFLTTNGTATSWGAVTSVATYAYDSRANIRSVDGPTGATAAIENLGVFVWESGSTQLDDDETCFATTNGRWLLYAASWDIVNEYWGTEIDQIRYSFLLGEITVPATTINGGGMTASFTGTVYGAVVGAPVCASPVSELAGQLGFSVRVSAADTVTLTINNPSQTSTISVPAGIWPVMVLLGAN